MQATTLTQTEPVLYFKAKKKSYKNLGKHFNYEKIKGSHKALVLQKA